MRRGGSLSLGVSSRGPIPRVCPCPARSTFGSWAASAAPSGQSACIDNAGVMTVFNSIAIPSPVVNAIGFDTALGSSSDYNIAIDDSAPGTNSKNLADEVGLFVDSTNADFRLPVTSPAVQSAINFTDLDRDISVSIDGRPRPANGMWDIGAFVTAN